MNVSTFTEIAALLALAAAVGALALQLRQPPIVVVIFVGLLAGPSALVRPAPTAPAELLQLPAASNDHWTRRIGKGANDAVRGALGEPGARAGSLCRAADEAGADAIVVGPRGLGAIGQAAPGSVASALLQTARRSVVVVGQGSA